MHLFSHRASLVLSLVLSGILLFSPQVFAQMSSSSYRIDWDAISVGGDDTSSSASYRLRDTIGGIGIGASSSDSYQVEAGYRAGIFDQALTFDVRAVDAAVSIAATSFGGENMTVADTGQFSVGDYVALVQDLGASQVVGFSRIDAIVAPFVISGDHWVYGGAVPVIDGTNDYLFAVEGLEVAFGTLTENEVATHVIGFEVSADLPSGYRIFVAEDEDLSDGGEEIDDVADGTVTAGEEEYGGRSSDTSVSDSTFDTQDTAFSTTATPIVEGPTSALFERSFLTLKASYSSTTEDGDYSHVLTFTLTPNF